jgi:FeS assembly protein IscX
MTGPLTWESTYAIALALRAAHPDANFESISLGDIYTWTLALDEFDDDPVLANDEILSAIFQDWYESLP